MTTKILNDKNNKYLNILDLHINSNLYSDLV